MVKISKNRREPEEEVEIPYCSLPEIDCDGNKLNENGLTKHNFTSEYFSEETSISEIFNSPLRRATKHCEISEKEEISVTSLRGTPRKLSLRRQSLDVLWNNTAGEKVKELLSQSIMKLSISSLTDKKTSEYKCGEGSDNHQVNLL